MTNNKDSNIFILSGFAFIVLVTLLSSLKDLNLLSDMSEYNYYYNNIINNNYVNVESTYKIMSIFFNDIGLGFRTVYFVYVFISLLLILKACNNNKVKSIVFLLYVSSCLIILNFIQVRSGLAIAIIFYAVSISNKNKVRSYILILIAPLFHYSTVLFIPVFFVARYLSNINIKIKHIIFFILLIVLSLVFKGGVVDVIYNISPSIIKSKIAVYKLSQENEGFNINVFSVNFVFVYICLSFYLLHFKVLSREIKIYFYIVFVLLLIVINISPFSAISLRYFYMVNIFNIILISNLNQVVSRLFYIPLIIIYVIANIYYSYMLFV